VKKVAISLQSNHFFPFTFLWLSSTERNPFNLLQWLELHFNSKCSFPIYNYDFPFCVFSRSESQISLCCYCRGIDYQFCSVKKMVKWISSFPLSISIFFRWFLHVCKVVSWLNLGSWFLFINFVVEIKYSSSLVLIKMHIKIIDLNKKKGRQRSRTFNHNWSTDSLKGFKHDVDDVYMQINLLHFWPL